MILGFVASTIISSGRGSIFELLVAGDPGMEDDVDIVNSVANKLSDLLQIVRYATVTIFYFKCVPMSFFVMQVKIEVGTRRTINVLKLS